MFKIADNLNVMVPTTSYCDTSGNETSTLYESSPGLPLLDEQPRQRQRRKSYKCLPINQFLSVCRVCRNQATGYHYDIPSCGGCKTFFRRTILNGHQLNCSKNGDCVPDGTEPIDTSKRICRACRFEKCVQAGMNPLAISAEVRCDQGKTLVNEVMKKRNSNPELLIVKKFITLDEKVDQVIKQLLVVEAKVEPVQRQGLPVGYRDMRRLTDILETRPIFNIENIPNLVPDVPEHCRRTGIKKKCPSHFVHSSFLAAIEYSKTFEYNEEIDIESKVSLMRHGTDICSLLMNSFYSIHRQNSDVLVHPDGRISGPIQEKVIKYGGVYRDFHEMFQRTLIAFLRIKIEKIEYILLKAIALCNPAVEGLSQRDQSIIEQSRHKFSQCLFNYCMFQRGSLNGPSRFSSLIAIISVVENQQKDHRDMFTALMTVFYERDQNLDFPIVSTFSELVDEILMC